MNFSDNNSHAGDTPQTPDDSRLIEGLRTGDMHSYEVLFMRYYSVFMSFCRGMVKDADLAQDICQNVFMKVWINRERLDPQQSIRNYIYVLCKREIIDYFRISKASLFITLEGLSIADITEQDHTASMSLAMLRTRVREVLAKLPPRRREVFYLSRFRNLSNQEIAMRMGISVRTVEKHIQLALQTLRAQIGDRSDYMSLALLMCLFDRLAA